MTKEFAEGTAAQIISKGGVEYGGEGRDLAL